MKLNLEIELDWIDEEKGLDEIVQQEIINGVTSRISKQINDKIDKKVDSIIDDQVIKQIDIKVNEIFLDFINKPVTLTDNYGSKIEVYDNMEALIKKRFDNFLIQPVDDRGNAVSRDSYGTKFKRLEFIIDKQLKDFANKFTTDAVKTVSEEIKNHVKEGLTTKLGSELMNVLKVNEMLQLPNGKK